MKKIVFNTLKYLAFLAIGISIFWGLYREVEWDKLVIALKNIKYKWIVVSVLFGLLSQLSRAMRWKMLIKPLGYNPKLSNTFLSVLVMYFINLILPRAGEVARCGVLSQTDKIPFTKLVGTAFIERLADFVMLVVLVFVIFSMNFSIVIKFFEAHPAILENAKKFISFKYILIIILALTFIVFAVVFFRRKMRNSRKKSKILELKNQFMEGIKAISKMENKWYFFGHTVFIFLLWLVMLYVVFLAYTPTALLSLRAGMVTFLMGGLAMLVPIQAGIGPWHYMVSETLLLYDISKEHSLIFALVAHSTTSLVYFVFGGLAAIWLIVKNGNIFSLKTMRSMKH